MSRPNHDIAATGNAGRKEMNRVDSAVSTLEAKTSTIAPQSFPAPQIQTVNASTAQSEKWIAPAATEAKVQAASMAVIKVPGGQNAKGPARSDNENTPTNSANFLVVGPSFVRAKPTADAAIIATLEPGARITVTGRIGEYYRIRSLGTEPIRGYVHKEDAFFERKS